MAGEIKNNSWTAPLPMLLLLLSATTGMVDAISVLGLGKVFTANMTGNIVFAGFAAVATPGFHLAPYLAALGCFLLGAVIAGRTGKMHTDLSLRRWLLTAAAIEAGLLWIAAIVAIGFDIPSQAPSTRLFGVIGLTAMAMGFRNATVRQLKVPDLTTTVMTLTLTGLAADSRLAGGDSPNWRRRVASVAAIFIGAMVGAVLVVHWGLSLPLALTGLLVVLGTILCASHPAVAQSASA